MTVQSKLIKEEMIEVENVASITVKNYSGQDQY